ncbi:hypothetical protein MPNT_170056 [Candidatus Methylacidithermus pantelleriae]|uniref:Type I restriction enzyme HindI endonuclease subunit-like C-terminal domain-containing protein n=1 Tax=Candidatus Methylacidithermus pantelleriae TaxID=2744239 RepID=A0A8J2FSA0_9BACT|nr:hypothetical protein MPNT_170056 [Candidatus Methylacidithermus pantelleriae]
MVDYLGLARELKAALATNTESGGSGRTAIDQGEAVAVMREKYEICCDLFYRFDWSRWATGTPQERPALLPPAQEHILAQPARRDEHLSACGHAQAGGAGRENGKNRIVRAVHELSQAFALAAPHEEALAVRDDVAFFQAVRTGLAKRAPCEAQPKAELEHVIR